MCILYAILIVILFSSSCDAVGKIFYFCSSPNQPVVVKKK